MTPTVTTTYPSSNIARAVFATPPTEGALQIRKAIATVLDEMGYRITGSLGKPIRKGVYMVAIEQAKR